MSQRPLFSCVIAVKGKRPYFDAALASLRAQGLGDDLEIIVQDADVAPDKGQSDAFNKGFAKARGEWFFWLNADDVMLPHALERVKSVIDSNGGSVNWVSGNLVYIDREDHILRCARERGTKNSYEGFPVRVYGPSSFFRRELFEAVGGFDLTCRFSMDIDLWCKFRTKGHWYAKVPHYIWGFRIHEGSLTSGDLVGQSPKGMEEEQIMLDERHQTRRRGWPLRRLQLLRLLDGSYLKSWLDTRKFRGQNWKGIP